jgi:Bacterial low temperature requirement A protein (LtrA)
MTGRVRAAPAPAGLVGRSQAQWLLLAAPTQMLREHYTRLLGWILATAPLWIAGAISDTESRLLWWAAAAAIDLAGTWLAHPLVQRRSVRRGCAGQRSCAVGGRTTQDGGGCATLPAASSGHRLSVIRWGSGGV